MKWATILALIVCFSLGAAAQGTQGGEPAAGKGGVPMIEGAGSGGSIGDTDLGISQGLFARRVVHALDAEHKLDLTKHPGNASMAAAELLAELGFSPDGGWRVHEPMSTRKVYVAYWRLAQPVQNAPADGTDGNAAAPDGFDEEIDRLIADVSYEEVMNRIKELLEKRLAAIEAERLPVSPTGAAWAF